MATASYESGAVRKMVVLRGSVWGRNARERSVFWPVRSLCTDLVCISFLPLLQEVRTICKTRNQFILIVNVAPMVWHGREPGALHEQGCTSWTAIAPRTGWSTVLYAPYNCCIQGIHSHIFHPHT